MPRLTDRVFLEALQAAERFDPEGPAPDSGLESLPPASAPLRVAPSFTVALLEMRRGADRAQRAPEGVVARAPELSEAPYYLGGLRLPRGGEKRAKTRFRLPA